MIVVEDEPDPMFLAIVDGIRLIFDEVISSAPALTSPARDPRRRVASTSGRKSG
jgi:hypothetical protein